MNKKVFKSLLNTTVAVGILVLGSQTWGAQWTDVTAGSTMATAGTYTLTDGHVYRPSAAAAFAGTFTLPDRASVTVGAASVATFLGSTWTKLTVLGGGTLELNGSDGVAEVITSLEKTGRGKLVLRDRTSGGLTITAATVTDPASYKDIEIESYGVATTLTYPADAGWGTSKLIVAINAKVTLAGISSCPYLVGKGHVTLPAGITKINFSRIKGFQGKLTTGAVVEIDYSK